MRLTIASGRRARQQAKTAAICRHGRPGWSAIYFRHLLRFAGRATTLFLFPQNPGRVWKLGLCFSSSCKMVRSLAFIFGPEILAAVFLSLQPSNISHLTALRIFLRTTFFPTEIIPSARFHPSLQIAPRHHFYSLIFPHFFIRYFFHLVSGVPSPRFNGGVLLGPLPIVTSVPLVSVPNPSLVRL